MDSVINIWRHEHGCFSNRSPTYGDLCLFTKSICRLHMLCSMYLILSDNFIGGDCVVSNIWLKHVSVLLSNNCRVLKRFR